MGLLGLQRAADAALHEDEHVADGDDVVAVGRPFGEPELDLVTRAVHPDLHAGVEPARGVVGPLQDRCRVVGDLEHVGLLPE